MRVSPIPHLIRDLVHIDRIGVPGGRIHVHYDNGGGKTMWQNGSHYNSPGGTVQSNNFTLPTTASQFRFSYRVRLDQGWLAFSDLKLIGWSAVIPVTAASQYELSLDIAGQLPVPVGRCGSHSDLRALHEQEYQRNITATFR